MANRAYPWSPFVFFVVLIAAVSLFPKPSLAWDTHVLLKFKNTLTTKTTGREVPALSNWVAGSVPCRRNTSLWTAVKCDVNGNVWALQMENMNLTGPLNIDLLIGLPALRSLSFNNNDLQGKIPDFGRLHALKSIFLSSNKFTGTIPDGIFSAMPRMKKVYFDHNKFSGPIPSSLVGSKKLLELRLDNNQFEGTIPDLKQQDLRLVNLSFNKLQGQIPVRLSKMDPAIFQGNTDLCGPPLSVQCPPSPEAAPQSSNVSGALLWGIILCIIAVLLAMLGLCFIISRRNKEEELPMSQSKSMEHVEDDETIESVPSEHHGGGKKSGKSEKTKLLFLKQNTVKFDIEDLLRASAEVLGSGNFGSSYKAILVDGPSFVVKRFKDMNGVGKEDFQEHMRRLGRLSHPNLLPLVAYYYRKEEKLLVTEYIPNGSLAHMLHGNQGSTIAPLDWLTRLKIIKGVARGLAYLYEELPMLTVPHGHLKSSNVLLNLAFEPILSDYGLVPVMNQKQAAQIMVVYKSPECEQNGKPSKKSDVWNFGVLILEILTGKFPANYLQKGKAEIDLVSWVNTVVKEDSINEVFDSNMKGTENAENEMTKLLQIGIACCETDVQKRYDMDQVIEKIEELKESENDVEPSSS